MQDWVLCEGGGEAAEDGSDSFPKSALVLKEEHLLKGLRMSQVLGMAVGMEEGITNYITDVSQFPQTSGAQ